MSVTVTDRRAGARMPPVNGRAAARSLGAWLLGLAAVELVLLYAPTVRWLFDRWTMSVWHNAHGMLIPVAVGYFAWQELEPLKDRPRHGTAWGFALLVPALLMHVFDTGMHTQILSAASIVVALPGLSLLFLGWERTRAIAFPLTFMVFMLPLPLALTERVHLLLREIATAATSTVVPLLGISLYTEGFSLHLREGILFVGDACSGFSTLYASCAVAALAAYTCDRPRGRVLALIGAVPIAIAANIVRLILLVFVVRLLGIGALDTWIHPASGMLTFALALPAILWLGRPSSEAGVEAAR